MIMRIRVILSEAIHRLARWIGPPYLVPEELDDMIVESLSELDVMRSIAKRDEQAPEDLEVAVKGEIFTAGELYAFIALAFDTEKKRKK